MLKLVSKFAMDILPSVIATIVGAYIVNHYINVKTCRRRVADRGRGIHGRSEKGQFQEQFEAGREIRRPRQYSRARREGEGHFRKGRSSTNRRPKSQRRSRPTRPTGRRRPQVFHRSLPRAHRRRPAVISRCRAKRPPPRPLPRRFRRRLRLPSLWLPRQIPSRRSKRPSRRMPTIWRARRSSACAVRPSPHRAPRKRPAFRKRPGLLAAPAPSRDGAADPAPAAAYSGLDASAIEIAGEAARGAERRSASSDAAGRYSRPAPAA